MAVPDELDLALKAAELFTLTFGGAALFYRIGRMTMKFEQIGAQQAGEIRELKEGVKELITSTKRIDRIEERMLAEGQRLDQTVAMLHRFLYNKIMGDQEETIAHRHRDQSNPNSA